VPSKATRGSTPSATNSGATVKPKTVNPKAPKKGDPKTVNPKTTTASTPEGSATGWFSWPKFCWHNVLCTVFICLIAASAGGGAFAYFSHGSDILLPSSVVVPDATALPTERGPLFAPVRSFQACGAAVFDQLQLRGECDKMCANVTVEEPGSETAMMCIGGLSADLPVDPCLDRYSAASTRTELSLVRGPSKVKRGRTTCSQAFLWRPQNERYRTLSKPKTAASN